MASRVGERIGPYEVLGELGRGGMGVVFEARDDRLRRSVALKAVHADLLGERGTRERLEREARAASGIAHPFVVQVYDVIEHAGQLFVVMEYVAGGSLQERLVHGPLPVVEAVAVSRDLANALTEAHARGVLHLDVKPSNILMGAGGHPRLADFGIARALPVGEEAKRALQQTVGTGEHALGTPGYMSPEQALGQPLDARADIFALGVVLYEMLTGRNPFAASNAAASFYALFTQTPPLPSVRRAEVPPPVDRLVMEMIAREPASRPESSRVVESRLSRIAMLLMTDHDEATATALSPPGRAMHVPPGASPTRGTIGRGHWWASMLNLLRPPVPVRPMPAAADETLFEEIVAATDRKPVTAALGPIIEHRLPAPAPRTEFARSGDVSIAYQVVGEGPIDIVYVPGWVSHVEYGWEVPWIARWRRELATMGRLILFDKRGTGLSDRVPLDALPTQEQRMDDVRAVMDAVGSRRAVLIGISEGTSMSVRFAATYPDRTLGVILIAGFATRRRSEDYPWAPTDEERSAWIDSVERTWGGEMDIHNIAPSLANDPEAVRHFSTYYRLSASPGAAVALARMNTNTDVRAVLPNVKRPALILHRTGDRDAQVEGARYMAAHIPNSRLLELPGDDHVPYGGDTAPMLDAIREFCAERAAHPAD